MQTYDLIFFWTIFFFFLSFPSTVFDHIFFAGVQDDEDVKRMLQGSSMVKVILEALRDDATVSHLAQAEESICWIGVVSSGAVASLAEATDTEAVGGRRYNLVSVSENHKSCKRATIM